MSAQLSLENLTFLNDLSQNNNREWFELNKKEFVKHESELKAFHKHLHVLMENHDQIESGKVFRIYRDVRFSKDKSPYKSHWSGTFKRATQALRGGYYYQIEPGGKTFLAGGFFGPNSQDLLHIRNQISQDPEPLTEVLNSEAFINFFGQLKGDALKTTPKGFLADDPSIDLLRMKQFLVYRYFSDEEVISGGFADLANTTFKNMRPFFDIMSYYLTTDLNGTSII